jgi:Uma2 family endonuclease
MAMVPRAIVQRRLTFEDYQQLPDDQDYEIVEGVLYVAPRPCPYHQIVANRLAHALTGSVEDGGKGTVVPDADLVISERDIYISPDSMVFLGDRFTTDPEGWIQVVPDLVVEVLSPSTRDYDRVTKRHLYAQLGVSHYWIVDPQRRTLTTCALEADGQYREDVVAAPESFRPSLFPGLVVDLQRVFG